MVLAAALSLLIGLSLGMLGGGGSILTVPIMVYALDVERHSAMAASLLVVGATSLVALVRPARNGVVIWRTGVVFALAGMSGSYVGARLSAWVPPTVLMIVLATMMLATGLAMLRKRADTTEVGEMNLRQAVAVSAATGVLTGLVGAGGGFVIVPALALVGGLPMRNAVATSLFVIALQSFAGFVGKVGDVEVDYGLVGTITASASVGAVVGGFLGPRVPQARLRTLFGVFVLLLSPYVMWNELYGKKAAPPPPATDARGTPAPR